MKIKLHHFWSWFKNHKTWSVIILLVIAGGSLYAFTKDSADQNLSTVEAAVGTIRQEVSVTGNVKPMTDVSLAFERGGKIASLNVEVGSRVYAGQVLASVFNADLVANLDQAKANVKKIQAGLGDVANQSTLSLNQSQISLTNTIKDSYTKADDALRNKIYSLFSDPIKYNAKLSFTTDTFLQEDIEEGKDDLNDSLDSWYRVLSKTDVSNDLETNYNLAKQNLSAIKLLLDRCAEAVNGLVTGSSGISQTQIDTWKLNISTARTNINTAIDTLTASFNQYKTASLSVKISQNSTIAEEAAVEQAEALAAQAEAELARSVIRSPINGLATQVDGKLGEIVSANKNVITIISYGEYEVETFVPEADIAKVKINDRARATLDAYGSEVVFDTLVIKIDPAATVIDGVPTYKVTLRFIDKDERVRAGMTANLDILTAEKNEVLLVPTRAVYTKDGLRYVKVLNVAGETSEILVTVGLRGSDGQLEILSGLQAGDQVITSL